MLSFIRRSLLLKIILVTVLVQLSMLGVKNWLYDAQVEDFMQAELPQYTQPISSLLNVVLGPPLFTEDFAQLASRTQSLPQEIPYLRYVWVDDVSDKKAAIAGHLPNTDIEPEDTSNISAALKEGVFRTSFDVTFGGEVVGHAHIGLDTRAFVKLRQERQQSLATVGIVSNLLTVLLVGAVAWVALRNLSRLQREVQRIADGDFGTPIKIHTHDEIGRLGQAFDDMRQALQKRAQEREQAETRLRAISDYSYAWEIWIDTHHRLVWTNPSCEKLTGYSEVELRQMPAFPHPLFIESNTHQTPSWQQVLTQPSGNGFESQIQRKDGQVRWVAIYWQPISDPNGKALGKRVSMVDVTERREAQDFLQRSLADLQVSEARQQELVLTSRRQQARFRALLSAMNLGILFETSDHRVEYVNPAFEDMWALDEGLNLIGLPVAELLEHSRHVFARPSHSSDHVLQVENTHETSEQFELNLADGRILTQISYPVHDSESRAIGRLWLYEDVTFERQTAEQLIYLAERDSLTGLYNRHRFQQEMERMVSISQRYRHSFALLYFDLDEFKTINDTYGHREGDTVLTRIAGELNKVVRKNDVFARLGGDEFAILTLLDDNQEDISKFAHRVVTAVSRIPFRFQGQNIRMTTSVGIAIYPDMATSPDSLVAQADAAMYQAKAQGKNTWSLYDQQRDTTVTMMEHMTWTQRIEHALENDLFKLHFQGIYRVSDRSLAHLEALVRLTDDVDPDNLYMPGQFIPVAEKTGKILAIDQWVVRNVIEMLAKHPQMPPVAVNISGRSFDDPSLPQRIRKWLLENEVQPKRLMIELTETAAVSDIQDAQRFIEALHQTGCEVCLDDFGAGFSSFAYLKHITADVLKIDGQFIHDLPNNPQNQIFLRAMLDVAKGLNKRTVAEFVETEAVLRMLSDFGIDYAQGYHLDHPQADHPAIPITTTGPGKQARP